MDDPVDSLAELEANVRDIERANAWFGGSAPILREVERTTATSVLDVGCGSADIPLALSRRAKRRHRSMRIVGLDRSDQMLDIARSRVGADATISLVKGDGSELPFEDRAFDVVTCSLTLHHCDPPQARSLLREMRRVAQLRPVVCDLRRSRAAYAATWAYTRAFTRNRLTRHDGPLSVLRAYTPDEAVELARDAGWERPVVQREPWFRFTLTDADR